MSSNVEERNGKAEEQRDLDGQLSEEELEEQRDFDGQLSEEELEERLQKEQEQPEQQLRHDEVTSQPSSRKPGNEGVTFIIDNNIG